LGSIGLYWQAEASLGDAESGRRQLTGNQGPMGAQRAVSNSTRSAGSNPAIANALLVATALVCGAGLLVQKGRLTWPPYQLLSSLSTLAGCLALVGPLILIRSGEVEGSLGELLWLTVGLLVWFFDIEAVAQGRWKTVPWATPLNDRTLGLAILAVLVAGWKCGLADRNWSWTNVTGWILTAFWVGTALCSWFLSPAVRTSLAAH
jgi:hypothetical protein